MLRVEGGVLNGPFWQALSLTNQCMVEEERFQARPLFAFYHLKRRGLMLYHGGMAGSYTTSVRTRYHVSTSRPTLAHQPIRLPIDVKHRDPLHQARVHAGRCLFCAALRVDALFSSQLAPCC